MKGFLVGVVGLASLIMGVYLRIHTEKRALPHEWSKSGIVRKKRLEGLKELGFVLSTGGIIEILAAVVVSL